MKYEFKNGSTIETIDISNSKNTRSQRGEEQLKRQLDLWKDYMERYPDLWIEAMLGIKLPTYQKMWIRYVLRYKWKLDYLLMRKGR